MLEIGASNNAQRIDNFLIARLKGVPKSHIYRMLRTGEVRVNRGRAKPEYRLQEGDVVRIPPLRLADSQAPKLSKELAEKRLGTCILHEDQDLLVMNKPFGIAVHGGTGLSFGLIEGLRAMRDDEHFLELVHRLDRDTSGCLLIAKKRSILKNLHEAFRSAQVHKSYLALLKGLVSRKKITVDQPLRKFVKKSGEWLVEIDREGKSSTTEFMRKNSYGSATLVEALPKTGRTHQIRAHAAYMGFPVAGDERYGDTEFNQNMRKQGLKRLFLHAHALEFKHPRDGHPIRIEAPLDPELSDVLQTLARQPRPGT